MSLFGSMRTSNMTVKQKADIYFRMVFSHVIERVDNGTKAFL